MEVMVAAVCLGFLYAAVLHIQKGNHESILRIRGRDGATEIAQNVIDSLSSIGLASFYDKELKKESTDSLQLDVMTFTRTWEGQPGIIPYTTSVEYKVYVNVSNDSLYETKHLSDFAPVTHVHNKRIDVLVTWPFKASTQSIRISSIIR